MTTQGRKTSDYLKNVHTVKTNKRRGHQVKKKISVNVFVLTRYFVVLLT